MSDIDDKILAKKIELAHLMSKYRTARYLETMAVSGPKSESYSLYESNSAIPAGEVSVEDWLRAVAIHAYKQAGLPMGIEIVSVPAFANEQMRDKWLVVVTEQLKQTTKKHIKKPIDTKKARP